MDDLNRFAGDRIMSITTTRGMQEGAGGDSDRKAAEMLDQLGFRVPSMADDADFRDRFARDGLSDIEETIVSSKRSWDGGFFGVDTVDVELPNGEERTRSIVRHPGAVGIIALDDENRILLVNDNPYGFILNEPQSILSVPGAREVCLEMNSLSKSHNMAGWRVGMMVGSADILRELLKVKSQMDSGMFRGIQEAAVAALDAGPEWYSALNAEYRRRREVACRIMDLLGCTYDSAAGGLYVWGRVSATEGEVLSDRILYGAGVFLTPGFIFGSNGAGYLRISLCADVPTLERAYGKILHFVQNDKLRSE